MVGTQRASPLDRMWTNLVSCSVSCQGGRHVLQGAHDDYAYHKPPLPEVADDDVTSGQEKAMHGSDKKSQMAKKIQVDEEQSPNVTKNKKNCQKKDQEQENRGSKWKRLRQTFKVFGVQKQNTSPKNGKVVKLRNGYKIIVPDIVITAPDDEKDSEKEQANVNPCSSWEE